MEILGLLTIALVAGTAGRMLYDGVLPTDVTPSLLLGLSAIIAGYVIDALTGVGEMTSAASLGSWVTALTSSCVLAIAADALRSATKPLRTIGRAS